MNVVVFVLGRPGSGKSTAARYINQLVTQQGCTTRHINDYDILKNMFLEDTDHKRFRPTGNNGFDAIDLSVLDIALHEVEQKVEACLPSLDLVTIEFARDDYRHALGQFRPDFLQDAYFLFMDADIETCLQRVHYRVEYAVSTDDHPSFSDTIFRNYYGRDNKPYISRRLQQEFKIRKQVHVIDNSGPLEHCLRQVHQFVHTILQQETSLSVSTGVLTD